MKNNPNCTLCPLHKTAKSVCIPYEKVGDGKADILVVGEAPGFEEDKHGRPFIGSSGRLLRTELARAGIKNYYLTNPIKCRPPNNRKPTSAELKACRPYLESEIRRLRPAWVVTAGAVPSKLLLRESRITQAHGKLVEQEAYHGYPVLHPAFILRDPSHLGTFRHDLERLARHLRGEKAQDDVSWSVVSPSDIFSIQEFLDEFEAAEEFSFDCETTSLFPYDRKGWVRVLGIGLKHRSWVLPLRIPTYHWRAGEKQTLFRTLVKMARGKFCVAQHGKFDNEWLRIYYGVQFRVDFDIGLAHHVLDENSDHDLKYLARSYLDVPEYDLSKKEKEKPDLSTPEKRAKFFEYNAKDCAYTLRLKHVFQRKLQKAPSLRRLYYHLVMPAARAMEDIELEGLTTDPKQYAAVTDRVEKDIAVSEQQLNDLADLAAPINWNSRDQIADVLFAQLKLPVMLKTPTGKPSTSEEAIVDLKGKHPIVNELLHYRELTKILGTYLKGWREYMVGDQLYLGYKLHGTVTGRYSSRLHQIPTDGDIRSIITAPPGWTFFAADLSQAELRDAAERSGDIGLVSAYRDGRDVHWDTVLYMVGAGHMPEYAQAARRTAIKLGLVGGSLTDALALLRNAGIEKCTKIWSEWKVARTNAKRINFGFLYGMYEKTFIKKAKVDYDWYCTWDQAHGFRTGFFELRPGLPDWHDRCRRLVRLDGYVSNMFGRRRRLPAIHSSDKDLRMEAERQAINAPVQGDIGDWKACALIEIHETIDREQLRLQGEHHDALLGIVRNGCEDATLPKLRKIMQRPKLFDRFKINWQVPMLCDINLGPWGAGKPYLDPVNRSVQ